MKALSVRQPHASLIVIGMKDVENRHWSTSYRGPLLIHASKHLSNTMYGEYERGGIVGMVTLVDVVTESSSVWFKGKYGLVLRDAHQLPFVPLRGTLGLFDVDESLINLNQPRESTFLELSGQLHG